MDPTKIELTKIELTKIELTKMMYLIRRRDQVSREELMVNWFANHMPDVIASQHAQAERGRPHARRYIATLFNRLLTAGTAVDASSDAAGEPSWDGVAQLWWDEPVPPPDEPHGTRPRDTFQQKAAPYVPWATTEYLVLDGEVAGEPNTLNEAYPFSRGGFVKVTALIAAQPGIDFEEFHRHWLGTHAENVAGVMQQVGGYRYAISLSNQPEAAQYAGMAELYFPDHGAFSEYRALIKPDGMDRWVDYQAGETVLSDTEMVGIA